MDESSARYHALMKTIKDTEEKMETNKTIKMHIINYSKTRETYITYRKSGYSKKFLEAHRDEITLHRAAARKCRKERHSEAFLSPRALYFLRTVCYGIAVQVSASSTTNLASVAAMASWSLFSRFVFCSILMTWYFTVDGSMPSSFAISL